jgi:hypothetical protein
LANSLIGFSIFVVDVLLIFGWTSLLIKHSGSLLHFSKNLLSVFGGFENLLVNISLLKSKLLCFSELHLLHSFLDFSDMSFGFLNNLIMLLFALLETMIMLVEDFFGF